MRRWGPGQRRQQKGAHCLCRMDGRQVGRASNVRFTLSPLVPPALLGPRPAPLHLGQTPASSHSPLFTMGVLSLLNNSNRRPAVQPRKCAVPPPPAPPAGGAPRANIGRSRPAVTPRRAR